MHSQVRTHYTKGNWSWSMEFSFTGDNFSCNIQYWQQMMFRYAILSSNTKKNNNKEHDKRAQLT